MQASNQKYPCIKINVKSSDDIKNCTDNLSAKIRKSNLNKNVAIAFEGYNTITFDDMMNLSQKIANECIDLIKRNLPIIVLIDKDIGKAYGYLPKKGFAERLSFACD